jgi:hypothetical protein
LESGRSVEVSLNVLVGRVVGVRGSLGESYAHGASPVLILATGVAVVAYYPVVVPDVGSVSCGWGCSL